MKKTITVNLNGRVFTMDEDAYRLLDNYLSNLRIYFRKEEGASEIIADFEARIEELLSEKTRMGCLVITIEQVEEVIARVGKPADFAGSEDEDEEKQTHFTSTKEVKKKFYRNIDDKMFGGVCSGMAAYFGWDVLPVRIIFIILLFATTFWLVPIYLLFWILVPGAYTAEQKLRMRGKPITVENIGKTVAAEVEPPIQGPNDPPRGCVAGFLDFIVALMKIFLVGVGVIVGLLVLFALIIAIITIIAVLGFGVTFFGITPTIMFANYPILSTISLLLVVGIPIIALIYAVIAYFSKSKPMHRSVRWTFIIVWLLAFILLVFSGFKIEKQWKRNNWNLNWISSSDFPSIKGNGVFSEKTYNIDDPVNYIVIGKNMNSTIQIEQIESDTSLIKLSGDENLIDQIKYEVEEGRLKISSRNLLLSNNNLVIWIYTGKINGIKADFAGNIQMNRSFSGEELELNINGPVRFQADSLFLKSLNVNSEGISSISLSGKTNKARLNLSGVGKIEALELVSDTVYAKVEGVGSIQCNPIELLEGKLQGIGKITYKDEPKNKNTTSEGIGKIGKR